MTSLSLNEQFKKLRLSGIMETYEARLTSARENGLSHSEWLSLLLQDEIQRREALALEKRFKKASFEQTKTFEEYEISRYPLPMQHLIRDLMGGIYLHEKQHVLAVGPTGTGKTHLAQALGHQVCRQGKSVRFIRASVLLREMHASRADRSWEKTLKKLSIPDLLIIDDFGLSILTLTHAEDFYELVAERHLKSSFIITSNRKVEAWVDIFPDPAMGNAVVDRLTNNSYHAILEGDSYRRKMRPKTSSPLKKESLKGELKEET